MYDLRARFLPLCLGESVTARVLSGHASSLDLDGIGYTAPVKAAMERALGGWGAIVVTGPTGCGKTTTLHAPAKRLVSPGTKIVAVEDPVEYMLPGVAEALERKATDDEPNALAVGQGMISFAAQGMPRAAAGETTVEEVLRFVAR